MKIKLKNTKLVDADKNPVMFFHATPCDKIKSFLPLSHFGTSKAANMRAAHFVYKALGMKEPNFYPENVPDSLVKKLAQQTNIPPLRVFPVYLAMKSPVEMPDLTLHGLAQYYQWFSRKYVPKTKYLTKNEWCEGTVVGQAQIKYKKLVSDFIFLDPFTRSEGDLKKELSAESFFLIPTKTEIPDHIPAFLLPVLPKVDKRLYSLAEKVAFQRMMRYLEGEGHDGFVYQNECEDEGQKSYIIFRPEQVFN
ncbi:MAG: hypothetical protein II942_04240, partial [Alphaproteobacteria bacterium]|nr:hypothetical protein [Alphaproteobacteria bacterium]